MSKEVIVPSGQLKFKNREIAWPKSVNWSGKNGYRGKADGRHTFSIKLSHEEADELAAKNWPVRVWHNNDETDPEKFTYFMNLTINYHGYNQPKVFKVDVDRKLITELTEDTLRYLDGANVRDVNVVFHAGLWRNGSDEGMANYVDVLYVNVQNMIDFGNDYQGYTVKNAVEDDIPIGSPEEDEAVPFV